VSDLCFIFIIFFFFCYLDNCIMFLPLLRMTERGRTSIFVSIRRRRRFIDQNLIISQNSHGLLLFPSLFTNDEKKSINFFFFAPVTCFFFLFFWVCSIEPPASHFKSHPAQQIWKLSRRLKPVIADDHAVYI
jgi:hypothetical protein